MQPSSIAAIFLSCLAIGCGAPPDVELAPDDSAEASLPEGAITWHDDVAAIFADNCITCHEPGGLMEAIDLHQYEHAYQWRGLIAEQVEAKAMPPFPADTDEQCQQRWGFQHDRRLGAADIATILAWVEDDAPEGDPANQQTYTAPEQVHLDRVDMTLHLPEVQRIPPLSEVSDTIMCFILDHGLEETGYLLGMETVVDNRKVLHHVGNYLSDRDYVEEQDIELDGVDDGRFPCPNMGGVGEPIGGYVPGVLPLITPDGSGIEVTPDKVFLASVHYHGIETEQQDNTSFQFKWAAEVPEKRALTLKSLTSHDADHGLLPGPNDPTTAPEFFIPAGESWHTESMYWEASGDTNRTIYSILGHMHLVGTHMRISIERADGSQGPCLLEIPRWDFDWQLFYTLGDGFQKPVIQPGDRILIECTYDNTMNNPGVVRLLEEAGLDEPQDTLLGLGSADEMCEMVIGVVEEPI